MTFYDFTVWARQCGVFLDVDEFDIWVNSEGQREPVDLVRYDYIFDRPVGMVEGRDRHNRMHLLVIDAGDPCDIPTGAVNYAVWVPVVVEPVGPRRVRFTYGDPSAAAPGAFARWLHDCNVLVGSVAVY